MLLNTEVVNYVEWTRHWRPELYDILEARVEINKNGKKADLNYQKLQLQTLKNCSGLRNVKKLF